MAKQKTKKVGIYVRLSKEDTRSGESVSIENQKLMLTKYVKDNNWILVSIYCDDGFSGTNQNRPALQKMFDDIRQGSINTVLIKDLSRLGRNYLEVGNLAEVFFPEHGCELISLSEKVDEMMVFRNWFNEQHSRETGKKVKAIKKMCAQNGKYIGAYAPYGYSKSDSNKHLLVPNENTAVNVKKIFELRSQGLGYKAIATQLNELGIIPPRDFYYQQKDKKNPLNVCHAWTCVAVKSILSNEVYIGNMVQGKYGSASYKSHKLIRKPEDEWIRIENTHEPIINSELWNTVQSIAVKNYHPKKRKDGTVSIFCGILYCADCGFKMRSQSQKSIRKSGKEYVHNCFKCGTYSRSSACTPHTIGEETLLKLVTEQIQTHAEMVDCNEKYIIKRIIEEQNKTAIAEINNCKSELHNRKNRLTVLDTFIEKLYEDRLTGIVPETTFKNLIRKYEQERLECEQTIIALKHRIEKFTVNENDISKWITLIRKHIQFNNNTLRALSAQSLLALIDRIEIGESTVINGTKTQDIKIVYKFVGNLSRLEESGDYLLHRRSV